MTWNPPQEISADFRVCAGVPSPQGVQFNVALISYSCRAAGIDLEQELARGLLVPLVSPLEADERRLRGTCVNCPKCHSDAVETIPAEIRLYRNSPRTLSLPPMTPSPDVSVCLDCGCSEFLVPNAWLAAGWLKSHGKQRISGLRLV